MTKALLGNGIGGREQLSMNHSRILHGIFGDGFERIELNGTSGLGRVFGYVDGVTRSSIAHACQRIIESGAQQIFLDGSNLGRLAEGIKRHIPGVEILTLFHNCEARFFLGALAQSKAPRALAVLFSIYMAERTAVRFSDKRICLSQRDSDQLLRIYGLEATHISAIAMQDMFSCQIDLPPAPAAQTYALFVGGAFYANRAGIAWFCRNVSANVSMKTLVVGKGFDALRSELEQHKNVKVLGEVKNLAPLYLNARVVLAPIFDGSGMKTKVAEALMFGKRIIGTPQAFAGYEEIAHVAGEICRNGNQFIDALEREARRPYCAIEPGLRRIFVENYSLEAATARMLKILS